MTKNPKQMFSSSEDDRNMIRSTESNPLAWTSLILAMVAVFVSFGSAFFNEIFDAQKVPAMQYGPGDPSVVADNAARTLGFLGQAFAFLVTNMISATLSAIAFVTGFVALARPNNMPAVIGIMASVLSVLYSVSRVFG